MDDDKTPRNPIPREGRVIENARWSREPIPWGRSDEPERRPEIGLCIVAVFAAGTAYLLASVVYGF